MSKIKTEVKVLQTSMMRGPGVCGHDLGVPKASPALCTEDYFERLFYLHGKLETPPSTAPKQPHMTSSLKDGLLLLLPVRKRGKTT